MTNQPVCRCCNNDAPLALAGRARWFPTSVGRPGRIVLSAIVGLLILGSVLAGRVMVSPAVACSPAPTPSLNAASIRFAGKRSNTTCASIREAYR